MKNTFLLFILTLCCSALCGQGYLFNSQDPVYLQDSLEFRFLCTDPDGLIYIGTNRGLFFYDGLEAEKLVEGDFTAGFHTGDKIMLGDPNGVLYTASGNNLQVLSWGEVADSSAISDIQVLGDKKLIATEGEGVYVLDRSGKTQIHSQNGLLKDDFVYQVEVYQDDIWLTTDRGVDRFWPSFEKKAHYKTPGLTKTMTVASSGLFFAGYSSGLSQFVSGSDHIRTVNPRTGIDKIVAVNDEIFALEKGSLSYLNGEVWIPAGSRNDIVDIIQSKDQNLISLHADGSIGFTDLSFLYFDLGFSEDISAVYHSRGELFVASEGKINRIDLNTGKRKSELSLGKEVVVVDLAVAAGNLYCATFNRGLIEINLETGIQSDVTGLPDKNILSLAATESGEIWISTLSGLSKYVPGTTAKQVDLGSNFPSTYIYKVFSEKGNLWLGTDGNGVFKYANQKIEKVLSADEHLKNSVYDMTSDGAGTIYAISLEYGVLKIHPQPLKVELLEIFKSNDYNSFGVSADGEILLSTDKKIILANAKLQRQFTEYYFPTRLSGAFMHTFSEYTEPWLYFASGNGLYAYRSRQTIFSTPSLVLNDWEVNYVPRSFQDTRLSSGEQNHVFRFATSSYRNPENQKIEVRLAGYEVNFRTINSREVNYPQLPPGKYILQARLSENGYTHPHTFELLEFKIAEPVYFQWWFILLCVLILSLSVFWFVRIRLKRLNQSRMAEQKLLESELSLLRNQVNPHFLFNSFNTLMNLIEQEPKEANEYLQRLSDFYRRMLEKNEDQVVTLDEELVLAREYCYLQKKRFGKSFNFVEKIDKNSGKCLIPVLTLQLLIENAIKHNVISRSSPLNVILENKDGYLCLRNKIAAKREPAEGTGLGLENIRKRFQSLFNAQIKIKENDGWFEVYLPIIN